MVEAFVSPTWFMIDLNLKRDSVKRWALSRVCLLLKHLCGHSTWWEQLRVKMIASGSQSEGWVLQSGEGGKVIAKERMCMAGARKQRVCDRHQRQKPSGVHPRDPPLHAPQTALTAGNQMLMGNMPHLPHSKFSNAPALKEFPTSVFIHLFSGAEVKIRASWLLGKCSTTELQSRQTSFIIFNTRRISLEKPSPRFFRIREPPWLCFSRLILLLWHKNTIRKGLVYFRVQSIMVKKLQC